MLFLYITELLPIAATAMLSCVAMVVFGVLPASSIFSGFGNDIVFMLAGMTVVGSALFETGAAGAIGKRIISLVGTNEKVFIAALILFSIPLSAFLSNSGTAAIMLPIAASAISASGGKLTKKNTYMMVGVACVAGGGLTLVSSTPQLIAQGLLQDGGYQGIGFFELGLFGLPILALLMVYCVTIGHSLQKKFFDFPEIPDDKQEAPPTDGGSGRAVVRNASKMWISAGILVFCVIGFIAGIWTLGTVAALGAVLTVATGCISQKAVFEKMDWTSVIVMGCSFGFAAGFDRSGAGKMIADSVIGLLGDNASPWLLFSALALVTVILTNFMTSTATSALLIPIAIFTAAEMGYDVKSAAIVVAIAANIGYATPISTPALTMTLSTGYRFKDYVKVGGLFNILAYLLLILLFPLVFN